MNISKFLVTFIFHSPATEKLRQRKDWFKDLFLNIQQMGGGGIKENDGGVNATKTY
jgi:hypothetical protein